MQKVFIENLKKYKDYLIVEDESFNIVFSTANENRSFNRHTEEGVKELKSIKDDFAVESVQYLKQVHSDKVLKYNGEVDFINHEGDAVITNNKNIAVGVFTADCVPILLVDNKKLVGAAIHSGWKGTYNSIVKRTIEEMKENYGANPEDLKAYIGPHIRKCCYEVSEDLKDKFIEKFETDEDILFTGRNLNLEACIHEDLLKAQVLEDNIYTLELCTHCEELTKLFSYRKSEGSYGRLFSFIIVKL